MKYNYPRLLEKSGLGKPVKVFKVGEVVQVYTKRDKLRERPGKTVADIRYYVPDSISIVSMDNLPDH